ncbi:Transcriptional regulator protein [Mycena venus]|uniref:Transcriptional regulator protein n=1 Tax=Mycena venus TaxID=2733690 RepID=A0A8H6XS38_9AGAR|nr:Transcriptional regulator protein [Mycena venus]
MSYYDASDTDLATWPEDPLVYAKIIEILPEMKRAGGMEMKQHVRRLWEAAAMWGYRDGYTDGYIDGIENEKEFTTAPQPMEFDGSNHAAPWTRPSRTSSPIFSAPQVSALPEENLALSRTPPDQSSPFGSSRTTSPWSTLPLAPLPSGMARLAAFEDSVEAPLIRLPRQRSSYPLRSTSPSPFAASTSSDERFACQVCGRDFSRAHDRKRHYETQHAGSPSAHRCTICGNDFSRADSLKRHVVSCEENLQRLT